MFNLNKKINRCIVLLSPFAIIGVIYFIITLLSGYAGKSIWVINALLYWGFIGVFIFIFGEKDRIIGWFKRPIFIKRWLIIGIIIGVFPIAGILLQNLNLINLYPGVFAFVIIFALINPWFEEGYWRGILLDAGERCPRWFNIVYSSILYAVSHPLMWGIYSIGNRSYQLLFVLFIMGIIWSLIRYKTSSLRWSVYSHFLVDIGNLSIFVFLNLYIPPGM